jgi:hypothetical protein
MEKYIGQCPAGKKLFAPSQGFYLTQAAYAETIRLGSHNLGF